MFSGFWMGDAGYWMLDAECLILIKDSSGGLSLRCRNFLGVCGDINNGDAPVVSPRPASDQTKHNATCELT